MGSSYGLTISSGTHDDLYAKALVLEKDGQRAALVACDLISLRPAVVEQARRLIEAQTGLRPDQVILSATHDHCGPQMHAPFLALVGGQAMQLGEQYRKQLPDKIAESVRLAAANLRPAQAWAAVGHENSISFNRRYLMKDGTVRMNPGAGNPDIVKPMAGIDPAVPVVYFDSPAGEPLATYVNFALHVAICGGSQFSADYPGVLARLLARDNGPDMLTVFTIGAAGDVNHLDVRRRDQLRGEAEVERIGTTLARDVVQTYKRLERIDESPLRTRLEHLQLPTREVKPGELDKARRLFSRYGSASALPFLDVVWAWRVMEVAELAGKPLPVDVQVISLGDRLAWVGVPGEFFVDLGLRIKRASPFPYTIVEEVAASGTISYVPTERAFAEGSYEVLSSRVAPGGGEIMADAAIKMLQQLHPGRRAP